MKLTIELQRLLEIETARVRHAWAKAELKRAGSSPALKRYVVESREEWRALSARGKKPKPIQGSVSESALIGVHPRPIIFVPLLPHVGLPTPKM